MLRETPQVRQTFFVTDKKDWGGGEKRKTAVFRVKLHFTCRKSSTKFLYVNTVSE